MYEQERLRQLRRVYSRQGWTLLIYYGILNLAVILVMVADIVFQTFSVALSGQELDEEQLLQAVETNSGWGYFLAIGVGLLILLLWKKPRYVREKLFTPGKPMKFGSFLALTAIFLSVQLFVQFWYMLLEYAANGFGYTLEEMAESAGGSADSLSMFLYVGLGAPISEELLFRGLILRDMQIYGKKFAIFASSLLFGLYHGNLVQIPFAFAVGLVLAYVTVEYNIGWAIVLHTLNNLILSDTLVRLTEPLGLPWSELWFWGLIIGCTVAAVVILIVKRRQIKSWLGMYRDDPLCARSFWSAPGIITLLVILGILTLVGTALMLTPIT